MTVVNTGRSITIVLDGIAEQQVVYNALHDYYRNYKGENSNHWQLASDMADQYHDEYVKDMTNEPNNDDKIA